jgi:hypothetical protein
MVSPLVGNKPLNWAVVGIFKGQVFLDYKSYDRSSTLQMSEQNSTICHTAGCGFELKPETAGKPKATEIETKFL